MVIDLDVEQCQVLRDLISNRLGSLSSEIRHTDSPSLRQGLRDEREVLRGLADRLGELAARSA